MATAEDNGPTSAEIHAKSKVAKVDIGVLKIDRSYQRVPSPNLLDRIRQDWDIIASELLLVSNRGERNGGSEPGVDANGVEGGFFLVNGQHRSIVAKGLGLKTMDARIIDLSAEVDPAAIEAKFRLKTNVGLSDKATERFKAQLRSGDEESIEIVKILARAGTEIRFDPTEDVGFYCVSALESVYRFDHKGGLLQETLEMIRDGFTYAEKARTASMVKAVFWFINVHYEEIDSTRMTEKMQEIGASALDRRARTIQGTMAGSLWFNYYRALVDLYNERLPERSRLEWTSKSKRSFEDVRER